MLDIARRQLIGRRVDGALSAHINKIAGPHRGGIWSPRRGYGCWKNSLNRHVLRVPVRFLARAWRTPRACSATAASSMFGGGALPGRRAFRFGGRRIWFENRRLAFHVGLRLLFLFAFLGP